MLDQAQEPRGRDTVINEIRFMLEYAPPAAPKERWQGWQEWRHGNVAVCPKCYSRILGRGLRLPKSVGQASMIDWQEIIFTPMRPYAHCNGCNAEGNNEQLTMERV